MACYPPVLVTPPDILPVSLAEMKDFLEVTFADHDQKIEDLIRAATDYYDGWHGVLGRYIAEQEWRQDFDGFSRDMPLPLAPIMSISSVTHRSPDGTLSTIATSNYALMTGDGGRSFVRFDADYSFPTDLHENKPVAVTYKAGYETIPEVPGEEGPPIVEAIPAQSTVPWDIKAAIKLRVQLLYEEVMGSHAANLERAENTLISKYRMVGV